MLLAQQPTEITVVRGQMFSITVDVVREMLELSLRGTLTDAQLSDLAEQLNSALLTLPPSRSGAYRIRVRTRPNNPRLARLAARICQGIERQTLAALVGAGS